MSNVVIYTGPRRLELNLRTGSQFRKRDQIPAIIKAAIDKDSAFANFFEDLSKYRLKPLPGSNAFAHAKIVRQPPVQRTVIHPAIRRR
jgi:hypothetical protein